MLGSHSITSGAVDCTGFVDTVAAVAAVAQGLVLAASSNEFVRLPFADGQGVVRLVADFHKNDRSVYRLGAAAHN